MKKKNLNMLFVFQTIAFEMVAVNSLYYYEHARR